jgi:4'-phosphopantetheinyl transferase
MVRVRWLTLDGVAENLPLWHSVLDPEEASRADRFRFAEDRTAFIAAHALLRGMLTAATGQPPAAWRYDLGAFGKPHLAAPFAASGLRFSISHTRQVVACALARDHAVGVDVETISERSTGDAIAERFFAPDEARRLSQAPPDRRLALFFRLWTLKEAFIKATGEGMSRPLDSFAFDLDPVRISFAGPDASQDWQFVTADPTADTALALALHRPQSRPMRLDMRPERPATLSECLHGNQPGGQHDRSAQVPQRPQITTR